MTLEPNDLGSPDDDEPSPEPKKKKRLSGGRSTMVGAAMLAVGEIIEPEKASVEISQPSAAPEDDPPFDIDFGDLPLLG
ncbi:MAG: hypothetical protein V3V01_17420 [Acidimicrobiales bacterium]